MREAAAAQRGGSGGADSSREGAQDGRTTFWSNNGIGVYAVEYGRLRVCNFGSRVVADGCAGGGSST